MLAAQIRLIGEHLVHCQEPCAGVQQAPQTGILPRGLLLERRDPEGRGCLVAGLNPGRSTAAERAFYLDRGVSYEAVTQYWQEKACRGPYYIRLRKLVTALGLSGHLLWSDLAKCESAPETPGLLPLQTLRTCSGRFLRAELSALPPAWPLFGVGTEAFKALAYLEPTRTVIGVPHPTGARGWFAALYQDGGLKPEVVEAAHTALASPLPTTVWLSAR